MVLENSEIIEMYGSYIDDFEISPFESVYMLHIRSGLKKAMNELTNEERIKLIHYDLKLIENAKRMTQHLGEIYDFSLSNEPLTEWWWHFDRVV